MARASGTGTEPAEETETQVRHPCPARKRSRASPWRCPGGSHAAVREQEEILCGAGQARAGAEGPVEVVGAEFDAAQVDTEKGEGPGVDAPQENAQALLGNQAAEAQSDRDVQAVDDVVAQGSLDPADRRFPGVVRVVAEEGGELRR